MAKKRMVHERIWDSDQFMSLKIPERLLYIALIVGADDEGCFRAAADYWKRKVFYGDRIGTQKINNMIQKIEKVGLIITGITKKGLAGCHPNWHSFQTLRGDRSQPSEYFELLVANGLPIHFAKVAQDKLSKDKLSKDNMEGEKTKHEENMNVMRESWQNYSKKLHKISNDFGSNEYEKN